MTPRADPTNPEWHATDFIIGNPPFLGGQDMQGDLGGKYVSDLRGLYTNRVPGSSDLVLYWFEKARAMIEASFTQRAGLIGTQAIRGGENRRVLEAIKSSGDIFWAISDRKWPQPNSKERKKGEKREKKVMVHISMVAFDGGLEKISELDGQIVPEIHANLKSGLNTTTAYRLKENQGLSFQGPVKVGKFEISPKLAEFLLASPNPHLKSNSLVIRPWMNGNDIKLRPKHRQIIDFSGLSETEAALFERPFDHIKKKVFHERQNNKDERRKKYWWLHGASGSTLKKAVEHLDRFVITTRHSKHRIFSWAPIGLLPDSALVVIARQDDFFFGVLHSKLHEVWARQQGTQLREVESGFRYTPKSTFDTFPFPYPPNNEPRNIPAELAKMDTIAAAARRLVELRDNWLNPADISEADLKKRTLTRLYNDRPTWLVDAHRALDEASSPPTAGPPTSRIPRYSPACLPSTMSAPPPPQPLQRRRSEKPRTPPLLRHKRNLQRAAYR